MEIPTFSLRSALSRRAAITILEMTVAVALIGMAGAVAILGMTSLNRWAAVNRNYTAAKAIAQSYIDGALSVPYAPPMIPAELTEGTTTFNNVTIAHGPPAILGTVERVVSVSEGTLRRVRIGVTYTFRGRTDRVQTSTVRASD